MSLTFGGATSDRVNLGSPASLDNLNPGTYIFWTRPTTLTSGRTFWSKGSGGTNRKILGLSGTGGDLQFVAVRATTNTQYVTNSTPLSSTGVWYCVALTFNSAGGAGQVVNIYVGTLSAALTEATYGTATDGSGTVTSDAADSLLWGNSASLVAAIQGDIAYAAVFNRELTLGECQAWQFRPASLSGCVAFQALGFNGASPQTDWSGNGNAGGVTGATQSAHVPLGPLFGCDLGWPGAFFVPKKLKDPIGRGMIPWKRQ